MNDVRWARNILGNAFCADVFAGGADYFFDALLGRYPVGVRRQRADDPVCEGLPADRDSGERPVEPQLQFQRGDAGHRLSAQVDVHDSDRRRLNVILDPVFIFGLNMGIEGAVVATVISMFVSMLFVMSHFFQHQTPGAFPGRLFPAEGLDHPQHRFDRHGPVPDEPGGERR